MSTLKEIKENKTGTPSKNINVGKFITSSLLQIILILIWFISGANFIYLVNYYSFNKLGGMDIKGPPYNFKNQGGGTIPLSSIEHFINNSFDIDKWGFPYKNNYTVGNKAMWGNVNWFIFWLTNSIAYSYSTSRKLLYKLLNNVGIVSTILGNNSLKDYTLLLMGPILVLLLVLIAPISGYLTTIIGTAINYESITSVHWMSALFFGLSILVPAITTAFCTSFVQSLQLLSFFIILPLLFKVSRTKIYNTLVKNKYLITLLCIITCTSNAYNYINSDAGIIGLVITIIFTLYILFKAII